MESAYNISEDAGARRLPIAQFVVTSDGGFVSSSRRRVGPCCAEGQRNRGPKEPIARNTHMLPRDLIKRLGTFEIDHFDFEGNFEPDTLTQHCVEGARSVNATHFKGDGRPLRRRPRHAL